MPRSENIIPNGRASLKSDAAPKRHPLSESATLRYVQSSPRARRPRRAPSVVVASDRAPSGGPSRTPRRRWAPPRARQRRGPDRHAAPGTGAPVDRRVTHERAARRDLRADPEVGQPARSPPRRWCARAACRPSCSADPIASGPRLPAAQHLGGAHEVRRRRVGRGGRGADRPASAAGGQRRDLAHLAFGLRAPGCGGSPWSARSSPRSSRRPQRQLAPLRTPRPGSRAAGPARTRLPTRPICASGQRSSKATSSVTTPASACPCTSRSPAATRTR